MCSGGDEPAGRVISSTTVPIRVRRGARRWQWVRVQLFAGVVGAGFDNLSAAHVALWRYPGLEGVRPSQLADRVGITKQSVKDLLGHLEGHGYLLRVPDSV